MKNIFRRAELINNNGLVISAICGDLGDFGFERKEDNEFKIAKSKRIVDLAVKLNTNVVTTHIGVVHGEHNEVYQNIFYVCTVLGRYAFERGVTFAIETGPGGNKIVLEQSRFIVGDIYVSGSFEQIPSQFNSHGHGKFFAYVVIL